jgi:hypothetical protein
MSNGLRIAGRMAPLFVAAALLPAASHAQGSADAWQWRASIYGWLPSIGGSTSFPTGGGSSIDVDSDAVIDALEMVFMGSLEARKGRWGAFTDVVYVDLGASKSGSRDFRVGRAGLPAGVSVDANLDIEAWAWTLAGMYTISDTPQNSTHLLFGARMLSVEQQFDWTFNGNIASLGLPGRSGSRGVDETNWDAIVGLKGSVALSADRRWVLPYYVDVGTGDSDLTWQAMAGIGYAFDWGTVTVAWRYLDYQFNDSPIEEMNLNGGLVGLTFRW